jgi:hypothetical protein
MDINEMEKALFDLIGYMLTSARGLMEEPQSYGPFRLIEGVSRLCEILIKEKTEFQDTYLLLKEKIDERKFSLMTDEEEFVALMDETILDFTRRMKEI